MNRSIKTACCAVVAALAFSTANAADDPKVAAEIMALARAQWAAEIQGKSVAEQGAAIANDYTEFNQDFPVRIDGKELSDRLYEAQTRGGGKALAADMLNPKVQVYGDVAILTYNYAGVNQDKDGKTDTSTAKSTRVYAKMGGQWKLVHANFAPVMGPN